MKQLAKPSSLRLSGAAILALALAAGVPAARADFIKVNSLSITPGGTFYYGGASESVAVSATHGVIVQAASGAAQLANITSAYNYLSLGFNGGDWLGTGLTSHQAAVDAGINGVLSVVLYDNTQLGYSNWQGATALDTIPDTNLNQVLTRTTYLGDLDGNGVVDGSDFALQDYYLGASLTGQGDVNFDGIIDGGDYALMDYVLGNPVYGVLSNAVSFAGGGKGSSVVPEPTSGILLMFGAACLAGLRKRKTVA